MSDNVLPDPSTPFGERVRRRLREEQNAWFTTVGRDGTPQPNPVWFVWDGDRIVTYNLPTAARVTHVQQRPQVALHFNSDGGGDIVVVTGTAHVDESLPGPDVWQPYVDKYAEPMGHVAGSPAAFAARYSVPVVIQITKIRGY